MYSIDMITCIINMYVVISNLLVAFRLREELKNDNDNTRTINQVNQLLQDQNVNLEKQLLEIKLKLSELKEHKKDDRTNPSLVSFKLLIQYDLNGMFLFL